MEILREIVSSNVKAVKYNVDTNQLYVQFLRKKVSDEPEIEYVYHNVNNAEFQLIKEAESIGSVLRKIIKDKKFSKIELL